MPGLYRRIDPAACEGLSGNLRQVNLNRAFSIADTTFFVDKAVIALYDAVSAPLKSQPGVIKMNG
jgi:hypothetical protein